LFFDPSFLNSSSTYLITRSVTLLMVRFGTRRMENLPLTEAGMTVFEPGAAARELLPTVNGPAHKRRPRYRAGTATGCLIWLERQRARRDCSRIRPISCPVRSSQRDHVGTHSLNGVIVDVHRSADGGLDVLNVRQLTSWLSRSSP
jgi:hypothetical protein